MNMEKCCLLGLSSVVRLHLVIAHSRCNFIVLLRALS